MVKPGSWVPSGNRMIKLLQATIWLLSRRHPSRRLGCRFWRAGGCMFFSSAARPCHFWRPFGNTALPLVSDWTWWIAYDGSLHTYLGAAVPGLKTASDASQRGGAVGVAKELPPAGQSYVLYAATQSMTRKSPMAHTGVIIVQRYRGGPSAATICWECGLKP